MYMGVWVYLAPLGSLLGDPEVDHSLVGLGDLTERTVGPGLLEVTDHTVSHGPLDLYRLPGSQHTSQITADVAQAGILARVHLELREVSEIDLNLPSLAHGNQSTVDRIPGHVREEGVFALARHDFLSGGSLPRGHQYRLKAS